MKHLFLIGLFALLLLGTTATAQDQGVSCHKITLTSGESYIGTILAQNSEVLMIKTSDGRRYQFPTKQVKLVEKISANAAQKDTLSASHHTTSDNEYFSGQIELGIGLTHSNLTIPSSPIYDTSLCFGYKRMFNKDLFLGAGAGLCSIQNSDAKSIKFAPLFLRLQTENSAKKNSVFFGLDAGYSLSISDSYKGGVLAKMAIGLSHHISAKTSINAAVYGAVYKLSGTVAYSNPSSNNGALYYGEGTLSVLSSGIRLGLQF